MSLFAQSRAFQAAGALAIATAAVAAMPILASSNYSESYYADQIVTTFSKVGAGHTTEYTNATLSTSGFDFAAYFSNTCYRPTDNDMDGCREKFGPYANLKWTYESGKLSTILSRVTHFKDLAKLIPQEIIPMQIKWDNTMKPRSTFKSGDSVASQYASVQERSRQVWAICNQRFADRTDAGACFRRNIRMTTMRMEPVMAEYVK